MSELPEELYKNRGSRLRPFVLESGDKCAGFIMLRILRQDRMRCVQGPKGRPLCLEQKLVVSLISNI